MGEFSGMTRYGVRLLIVGVVLVAVLAICCVIQIQEWLS